MKMWAGRFREPLDAEFARWQRSFPFDRRLLPQEVAASAAYAEAIFAAGVLTAAEVAQIVDALAAILTQSVASPQFLEDDDAEDVHHFVEKNLVALIGDVGYKLHTGRSRNEQIATDLRLFVRESIDQLIAQIAELGSVLLARAESAGLAAMPAYTHLQRAEPVLVAHWLLAYFEMFLRDAERLADCRKRVNLCPLGSGAIAGSTIQLDRAALAQALAFDGPTANSMDATADRDFALEFVNALSLLALHVSRWAEEMILFSTQEFALVDPPEEYSTGSSAMPQKKNPDLLELARAKSARVLGCATALQVATKGLPLAYNKDLQDTQQPLFEAADTLLTLLPLVAQWIAKVQFLHERMQFAAQDGFLNAFAAATYLSSRGVPFRLAHECIGRAVQLALEKGCLLDGLSLAELQSIHPAFEAGESGFFAALKLEPVLQYHDNSGGTAPAQVKQALAKARQRLGAVQAG